ncbi:hypothetical protein LY76DRAFT_8338 [Colletotrichum caudatum]|nr:hypothetical protein LY76DRAFT_8338 [Colletotrichum caudatum]
MYLKLSLWLGLLISCIQLANKRVSAGMCRSVERAWSHGDNTEKMEVLSALRLECKEPRSREACCSLGEGPGTGTSGPSMPPPFLEKGKAYATALAPAGRGALLRLLLPFRM